MRAVQGLSEKDRVVHVMSIREDVGFGMAGLQVPAVPMLLAKAMEPAEVAPGHFEHTVTEQSLELPLDKVDTPARN